MLNMKKIVALLSLGIFSLNIALNGCSNNDSSKFTLTFGTYAQEALKIHYSDLSSKMLDGESMIVVTYDSDNSTCSCWTAFINTINRVVEEEHYLIYKILSSDFNNNDTYGFSTFDDRPAIHFVKDGKLKEKIDYTTTNLDPLFKGTAALKMAIEERCYKPNYYYLDYTMLDEKILDKKEFIVCYYWESCGDCKYSFPKFLYSYTKNKTFKIDMFLVNLEVEGVLLKDGIKDVTNQSYIDFLTAHNINQTSNHPLGYDRGYVPTYQYYQGGVLKDASVFFNDAISQKQDGTYYVSRSFYSEERVKNLHYLDKLKENDVYILEGMEIPNEQISEWGTWNQEDAYVYHAPLLEAFLNTYAI